MCITRADPSCGCIVLWSSTPAFLLLGPSVPAGLEGVNFLARLNLESGRHYVSHTKPRGGWWLRSSVWCALMSQLRVTLMAGLWTHTRVFGQVLFR